MSQTADSMRRQSRGLRALGLFAAVWLNLALAPCTMAMDTGDDHPTDHGCPHCPPAETHGNNDMHAAMPSQAPCAEDLSDCELDEDFSHDIRGGQIQLKDAKTDVPTFVAPTDFVHGSVAPMRPRAPPRSAEQLPAGPPVHLLNCVFLD